MTTKNTNVDSPAGWSEDELRAAVNIYAQMRQQEAKGEKFSKSGHYKSLSELFGRTAKSFEYRMQNISYAYLKQGRSWVTGLKPASNVGANILAIIISLIEEIDPITVQDEAEFESAVSWFIEEGKSDKPSGTIKPQQKIREAIVTLRNPAVKAYVLKQSQGNCEDCGSKAPFIMADGRPYLEVHHIKHLADGGSDTVENTVALCPNCHRALHYALNKDQRVEDLYLRITRLVRE